MKWRGALNRSDRSGDTPLSGSDFYRPDKPCCCPLNDVSFQCIRLHGLLFNEITP
ncbi:hypothetical protein CKO_00407 [Citrobacter koseri ATCC BAA-895]|uniref:Uncharacterized protein n=1 Tax=Citrobacter koseri (strain ATCC BAA-895 / CDC 4225-83 / SGSC4696) TaxID=290338 RepID=A8ADK2_CITK8|nr:hypothetical protein CKO_00407 [Citrobacter koseri ATCC BAA-895]